MGERHQYTETGVSQIGRVLAGLLASQSGSDRSRPHGPNTNFIMIAASPADLETVENLVDTFSVVHPSRFFILYIDPGLNEVKAEVGLRSHLISGRQRVNCEVIRIGTPPNLWGNVPNIVRGNLTTGMQAELFIHNAGVGLSVFRSIAIFVDQVIFDSSDFEGNYSVSDNLRGLSAHLVDLQWVRMGMWRDQLKGTFEIPAFRALLDSLESIRISATARREGVIAASGLLMAGWMAKALKLEPMAFGSSGHECRRENGSKVELKLETSQDPKDSRLLEIEMFFARQNGIRPRVTLKRSNLLETIVETDKIYHTSRPFDDESQAGLIRRYFLIGESIVNYPGALEVALMLNQLQQVFKG